MAPKTGMGACGTIAESSVRVCAACSRSFLRHFKEPDMASVNKVILVGNCGRDPGNRYLPSGPGRGQCERGQLPAAAKTKTAAK